MITHIRKWGNSLAIRFPQNILSQLGLKENGEVEIRLDDNKLILSPVTVKKPKYCLEELLSQITPENQQEFVDFGNSVGKEVW
jgi:antitoxin MazE